jgi:hypothetical protein
LIVNKEQFYGNNSNMESKTMNNNNVESKAIDLSQEDQTSQTANDVVRIAEMESKFQVNFLSCCLF